VRLTFDEADAQITNAMAGKTVDYVERVGPELHFYLTDGHVVVLQSTCDHHIVRKRVDVKVVVPQATAYGGAGNAHAELRSFFKFGNNL